MEGGDHVDEKGQLREDGEGLQVEHAAEDHGGVDSKPGLDSETVGEEVQGEHAAESHGGGVSMPGSESEKAPAEPKQSMVSFTRLFSFADKHDYALMLVGSVGAAVHGAGVPVSLAFLAKLLNGIGSGTQTTATVDKYAVYYVYLGFAVLAGGWMEVLCWMMTGERQTAKLRTKYLEALLQQDVAYFDTDTNTGDFISSIASDPLIVQDAISEKMGSLVHFMGTLVAGFSVGFILAWRLALVTIGVLPLLALAGGGYAYTVTSTSAQSATAYAKAGTIAEQAIAQVRTVYSFVAESKFLKAYTTSLEKTMKLGFRANFAKGIGLGFSTLVIYLSFAFLLWYGGVLVHKGTINGGEALGSVFAVILGSAALGQAIPSLAAFGKGRAAAYKFFKMIDHASKINAVDQNGDTLEMIAGHIEFRDVDFAYPSRPDVFVFRNFSMVISPGTTVAIVGSSGSGKSTVVSLIERFYDPIAGEVSLDGQDIKKLDLKWLRGRIGLVNQEPALFATTIAENILYGKGDATQKKIEDAAKAANAHSFIEKLPLGYQTQDLEMVHRLACKLLVYRGLTRVVIKGPQYLVVVEGTLRVGERGIQLSGGQKQRVAIARAMVRNPAVLLLDEATSALDAASEKIVQEALDQLMVGRTTIVVAHRLSTIRKADSIAVLQQGHLVEKGTHQELMSTEDGVYSALVRLQELTMVATTDGSTQSSELDGLPIDSSITESPGHSLNSGKNSPRSVISGTISILASPLSSRKTTKPASQKGEGDGYTVNLKDAGKEASPGSFTGLLRLVAMCQPEWKVGIGGIVGSILAGFLQPGLSFIIGDVLTSFYTSKEKRNSGTGKYLIILTGMGVASFFIMALQHYSIGVVGESLVKRVRERMLGTILRNELGWFDRDENSSGQILARLSSEATIVRSAIGDRTALILQNTTIILVSWIASLVIQWQLALAMISITPLFVFGNSIQIMFLQGFSGDLSKAYARATQVAGEAVTNIRTVAAFNAEGKVQELFAEQLKGPADKSFERGQVAGLGLGISQCLMHCSYGFALWYAGKLVIDGANVGNVFRVYIILIITSTALAETLALTPDIVKGGKAIDSVWEVLDRKTAIEPEDPQAEKAETITGNIELKGVTFAYPSRPDVIIFKSLNLKVHSGRSLALVGASGSGKSSVIALIERFYDPISGKILIDGKEIKNYNLKSLRQHIALVSQEPALFATTIHDNILYGRDGASEAEVVEAAKAANAHTFISSLPDGYTTQVGERGVQLSGGQKQRVAIARAVLKDPAILLLDEATSALDAQSEKVVQEALDRLMKGRTTVMIAHRLSTVRGADTIAVVQDGSIVEEGSHAELIANRAAYERLVNLQIGHEESDH